MFDLDPDEDIVFECVVKAALEVRERLSHLGMEGFCRTTGGKGPHVVTPLSGSPKGAPDWRAARAFTLDLCRTIAADAPGRYVVNMARAKRKGRIFLDYLRNDRTASAVPPHLSAGAGDGTGVFPPLLQPGTERTRSATMDDSDRAGPSEKDQGLGRLLRRRATAEGRHRQTQVRPSAPRRR